MIKDGEYGRPAVSIYILRPRSSPAQRPILFSRSCPFLTALVDPSYRVLIDVRAWAGACHECFTKDVAVEDAVDTKLPTSESHSFPTTAA